MKRFKFIFMATIALILVLGNVLLYQTAMAAWLNMNIGDTEDVTNPQAIAVQGTDVYVADYIINKVIMFDINGNNKDNDTQNQGNTASGIAVDDSTVYIMDYEFGMISTMKLDGSEPGVLMSDTTFEYAHGLAADGSYLYVADTASNRIVRMDKDGYNAESLIDSSDVITGPDDVIKGPYDVAVDNNYLYVTDTGNNRIIRTDKEGNNPTVLAPGLNKPWGIDVDGNGNIYFADNGNDAVKRMKPNGSELTGIYTIDSPTGVAVGSDGSIYITANGLSTSVTKVYYQNDDSVAPTISQVTVPVNDTYIIGDTLTFTVDFNEVVYVDTTGGTPYITLTLDTGGTVNAMYASGGGTSSLTFTYTVASGNLDADGITVNTAITNGGGTIKDAAGNNATLTMTPPPTTGVYVDGVAPVVTAVTVPSSGSYSLGATLDFTVQFNDNVTVTGTDSVLEIKVGSTTQSAVYRSKTANSITYRYTVQAGDIDTNGISVDTLTLHTTTVQDEEGNNATLTMSPPSTASVYLDGVAPAVTSVTVPSNGSYKEDGVFDFVVTFSEDVTVTGTDSVLNITVGSTARTAAYQSKTANSITYQYTVQIGDNDNDGIVLGTIVLNTTTVQDTATNDANLTLYNVGDTSGVLVDTTVPTVTSVEVPSSRSYKAGDQLDFTVNFSEAVTVSGTDSVLNITIGSTAKYAAYSSKTANSITYRYTVQSGDNDSDGIAVGEIDLSTTMVRNVAANDADMTLNGVEVTSGIRVDTTVPTVASVGVPAFSWYKVGANLDFTINFSEAVTVTGTNSVLGITVGSTAREATYQSKTAASITYRYTVQAGDSDSSGISVGTITLNGTTVRDAATNDAIRDLNSVGATTGVLIDGVAPVVTAVMVPLSGSYRLGDTLNFTIQFSEVVTVSGTDSVLGITVGSTTRSATYQSKEANSITYRYTVQAGDTDTNGISVGALNLNTTTVHDAVANDAILTLNGVGLTTGVLIDGAVPIVTSVELPSNGNYKAGANLDFTVDFSEAVTVTGTNSVLNITVGSTARTAAYQSKDSNSITYRYTVQAGDNDSDGIELDTITLHTTTVKDAAANDAILTLNNIGATSGVLVDTTIPTVASVEVPSSGSYKAGDALNFKVNFSEVVMVTGTNSVLNITIGSTARTAAFSSKTINSITYIYYVKPGDNDSDGIAVDEIDLVMTTVQDPAENNATMSLNSVGDTSLVRVDTIVPTVASVGVPTSGSYKAGASLDFKVNFSEAVTVTGTNSVLGITVGGTAREAAYLSKTEDSITYRYTVQAGDSDSDGISVGTITLNDTTVKDTATNAAAMALNGVGATSGVRVDTTEPTVTSATVPSSGSYRLGDTLNFTVEFSEAVTVTGEGSVLGITVGSTTRSAVYQSKSGNSITYRYTVQAGDIDTDGISVDTLTLNTSTVQDAAANNAVLTLNSVGATAEVLIDGVIPIITSVEVPTSGSYKAGTTLYFTVNFSEAVTVTGTNSVLNITVGSTARTAAFQSKAANSITYRYTVQAGDNDNDGIVLGTIVINTTTVQDAAANNADLTLNSVGATSGVLVDTTIPTIASVVVPSLGSYKTGTTLDFTVNFSEAVTVAGTDSILGINVGGTARTAAYLSETAGSITYRYTVQAEDNDSDGIEVGAITLNTTTVQDAAANNAVMTLNSVGATSGVLVDTTVPTVASVMVPSAASYKTGDTLDFTVNFSEAVTVTGTDSVLGITAGGTTRTAVYLSKTADSITYRYTVQTGDNDNDGITVGTIILSNTTVQDTAMNNTLVTLNSVGATSGIIVDTTAPASVMDITMTDNDTTTGIDGRDFSVTFIDSTDESDVVAYKIYLYKDLEQPVNQAAMDELPLGSIIAVKTIAPTADQDGGAINLGSSVTADSKGQPLAGGSYWIIVCAVDQAGNYSFGISGVKSTIVKEVPPTTGSNNNNAVPPLKKEGTLEKEQQRETGAPAANINNKVDTLKAGVFTAAEQERVKAGEDAKVTLKIEDISETVSDTDKKMVEEKLSALQQNAEQPSSEVGVLYVDISLFKQVGNGEPTKVTETSHKISISIEIPKELRNNNSEYSRTYQVVRVHDNEVEILAGSYDPVTHLFTFETDRFSVYALTYQDTTDEAADNTSGNTPEQTVDNEKDNIVVNKDFNYLHLTAKAAATTQKLNFAKVRGADGYLIYGAKCGKDMVELADVAGTVTSYTDQNLKKATYYKYQVKAYKLINGEKVIIAISKTVHSVTASKTYGNPDKVIANVSQITLEAGNAKLLVCEVVLPKGKKLKKHTSSIRYESSNKTIATISSKGKITAKAKGVCYIYAYAQNGVYKKIKVTVK